MSRFVALLVVVALHLGLIWAFTFSRKPYREIPGEARAMTVVFLPLLPVDETVSKSKPGSEADRRPRRNVTKRAARSSSPAPLDSTAITPQSGGVEETPAPATIDWYKEAELAASRQLSSLESANRESRKAPPPTPEFGWSHAQTHRIQPLPEGGTLIWINDRCAIVVSGALFPICKIGKIKVRGDLFEHMRDAPAQADGPSP